MALRLVRRNLLVLGVDPLEALLALLGSSLFGGGDDFDHGDLAARLFDRFDRALRRAGDGEVDRRGQRSLAEQANAVPATTGKARGLEGGMVERRLGIERAEVDELLDRAEVHFGEILGEDV